MCPVSVIRHQKERRSKCSLTALEEREDITFYKANQGWSFDVTGFTVLALNAPELSVADAGRPLLLLDSTWRLLPQLQTHLYGCAVSRTLPAVDTAYPRVSKLTKDPFGRVKKSCSKSPALKVLALQPSPTAPVAAASAACTSMAKLPHTTSPCVLA